MQKSVECHKKNAENNKITAVLAYLVGFGGGAIFFRKEITVCKISCGTRHESVCAGNCVRYYIPVFGGVRIHNIMTALLYIRIMGVAALVFPVLAVMGIINVLNGQEKELPVIGKIRLIR